MNKFFMVVNAFVAGTHLTIAIFTHSFFHLGIVAVLLATVVFLYRKT